MVKRRKKTEIEEVIEFLRSHGAKEITEKDPALKKRVEFDEERFQEYPKFIKTFKTKGKVV
jgi:hypothetical protein